MGRNRLLALLEGKQGTGAGDQLGWNKALFFSSRLGWHLQMKDLFRTAAEATARTHKKRRYCALLRENEMDGWNMGTLEGGRTSGEARKVWVPGPLLPVAGASQNAGTGWGRLRERERFNLRNSWGGPSVVHRSLPWPSGRLLENRSNTLLQSESSTRPCPALQSCRPCCREKGIAALGSSNWLD